MTMAAGRPSKFTPTMREGILKALRAGNTRTTAAALMGINRNTLAAWAEENEAFSSDIEKAEAYAQDQAVDAIKSQFGQQWTAAAWYLERKHPNEWGKRERVDVTTGGQPIRFTLNLKGDSGDGDSSANG